MNDSESKRSGKQRQSSLFAAVSTDNTLVCWVFLRLLGIIYLFAFSSLWPQIPGLIGRRGILPASAFLEAVHSSLGSRGYWLMPTLAWWNSGDAFLIALCAVGVLLSILLILDIGRTAVLIGLWACWLSLVNVGQDFLSFQWDVLLLETGFLAVFLVPGSSLRLRSPLQAQAPSRIVLWLLRWLLFRLLFLSGVVKLASGDPAWHSLNALRFHYETQPLPTPAGWYAHQFPQWFHSIETALVLFLEIVIPFLLFVPGRIARLSAFTLLVGLQLLILLTGNYAFFNLLTIALCILLLTDEDLIGFIPWRLRNRLYESKSEDNTVRRKRVRRKRGREFFLAVLTAAIALLSFVQIASMALPGIRLPEPIRLAAERIEPFHVFNTYGLFAVMTTRRMEIIVEGSRDGHTWKEYSFRYKPGDIRRAPVWVWPHQPRLDWQMWFAALSGLEGHPSWFPVFVQRLLEGFPEVLSLMDRNPFEAGAPRYVRAALYDYRFTTIAGRRATGAWWQRRLLGTYFPSASLKEKSADNSQK